MLKARKSHWGYCFKGCLIIPLKHPYSKGYDIYDILSINYLPSFPLFYSISPHISVNTINIQIDTQIGNLKMRPVFFVTCLRIWLKAVNLSTQKKCACTWTMFKYDFKKFTEHSEVHGPCSEPMFQKPRNTWLFPPTFHNIFENLPCIYLPNSQISAILSSTGLVWALSLFFCRLLPLVCWFFSSHHPSIHLHLAGRITLLKCKSDNWLTLKSSITSPTNVNRMKSYLLERYHLFSIYSSIHSSYL